MSVKDYTIRPFENADIPATGELLYQSKFKLTINRLLFNNWPNAEIQRQNYMSTLENLDLKIMESLTVIDDKSGQVVGHLTVTRKRLTSKKAQISEADGDEDAPTHRTTDFFNADVVEAVQEACMELDKPMADVDHLNLTFIIIHPNHRGQGLGKRLMEHLFNKSKSLGIPIVVSSEPQVYEYFKKQGFKDVNHVDFDLARWAPPYSGFGTFRLAGIVWDPKA
ncbi:GNAT family N-acetyltransferase [Aspergillus stella-maris]|uniref:GNAT family N-acetyltransferase n=1 Tax=Aspergillus stella-maris TaxID=1810926 RepID=UPI003CCD4B82